MTEGKSAQNGIAAYFAVTAAYWGFMLTDGALRMLVLLHFHELGYSPVQLAYLFILYEVAGIVTNLSAGWIAARFGLSSTLFVGLSIQIIALLMLTQLDPSWAISLSVVYVMLVQGLSGVAKDLSKMSAKSAVKLLAPTAQGGLFRWVAVLTGSKNAVKGVGFFIGAVLLGIASFNAAVLFMAAFLATVLIALLLKMPKGLPTGRKSAKFSEVFSKNRNINLLSFARMFLFGARDVWFVVGIPIYFYAVLSDGTIEGDRTAFFIIGSFMAIWIILYGGVQASAPKVLNAKTRDLSDLIRDGRLWGSALLVVPVILAALVWAIQEPAVWLTATIVLGLLVFGAIFAVNSSLHSYLILAFSSDERVTMDVGFYYMANAGGRLLGTLLSGLTYQVGGLPLCLGTAALLLTLNIFGICQLRAPQASERQGETCA
ncbi:MAG: organoarsenical effux MFS transporter ArsJ [Pseudomonadota bacterium]